MSIDFERVHKITPALLAEHFPGVPATWWRGRRNEMRAAGVLSRRGIYDFARLCDIEAWLLGHRDAHSGRDMAIATAGNFDAARD